MKPTTFTGLAVAAVASVCLAVLAYASANTWVTHEPGGARLFPALPNDAGRVASMMLAKGEQTLTLERRGEAWTIKEREGYPASPDKVRALMVKLAGAELLEPKTSNPERYSLLDLDDPAKKDAKSVLLRIADDKGASLAELVIGKRSQEQLGAGKSGTYVRKPGDPQTWLVNADISAQPTVSSWVDTTIFETDAAQIARIRIEIPGEAPLVLEKDKERGAFKLSDMPAGKKLKYEGALGQIGDAFARIELEDVRKRADAPKREDVSVASIQAEGGSEVTARMRRDGDNRWLSLEAKGEGEAKQAADKINGRVSGWEFKVPSWKADQIFKRRGDLFEAA